MDDFNNKNEIMIKKMAKDKKFANLSKDWFNTSLPHEYHYHFTWMGMPIIQFPHDILAMQEVVWNVKPDLIIETGIARGGSIIFYASLLQLIGGEGQVVGIDIDIREHNRKNIENHLMSNRIKLIQGSSIDSLVVEQVAKIVNDKKKVLVVLDSMHTHDHVLKELELYSPMVTKGSYIVVFDTVIEDIPEELIGSRPWGKGNNAKTAVWEFLKINNNFMIDKDIENKIMITVAPDGFLKKIK